VAVSERQDYLGGYLPWVERALKADEKEFGAYARVLARELSLASLKRNLEREVQRARSTVFEARVGGQFKPVVDELFKTHGVDFRHIPGKGTVYVLASPTEDPNTYRLVVELVGEPGTGLRREFTLGEVSRGEGGWVYRVRAGEVRDLHKLVDMLGEDALRVIDGAAEAAATRDGDTAVASALRIARDFASYSYSELGRVKGIEIPESPAESAFVRDLVALYSRAKAAAKARDTAALFEILSARPLDLEGRSYRMSFEQILKGFHHVKTSYKKVEDFARESIERMEADVENLWREWKALELITRRAAMLGLQRA